MNKKSFIEELKLKTGLNEETCTIINDVLENHFIIGKSNKEKIVSELSERLNINVDEAEKLYETASEIILKEVKNKIKHPFKSKD